MDSIPTTDVETMTHESLVDEYSQLGEELFYKNPDDDIRDALYDRRLEVWKEMESRVNPSYPSCPNCGNDSWAQTPGDPKECTDCGYQPVDAEMLNSIDKAWNRVLKE